MFREREKKNREKCYTKVSPYNGFTARKSGLIKLHTKPFRHFHTPKKKTKLNILKRKKCNKPTQRIVKKNKILIYTPRSWGVARDRVDIHTLNYVVYIYIYIYMFVCLKRKSKTRFELSCLSSFFLFRLDIVIGYSTWTTPHPKTSTSTQQRDNITTTRNPKIHARKGPTRFQPNTRSV